MTDPILRLDPARLSVEPGGQATLTLTVTNPGTIVEGYVVDVVSQTPVPWVEVAPPSLSVYPQQEATAVVVFSPPSGPGAPGGSLPFGVRVRSEVEGGGSAVAEGDLDIGSVSGLRAKLTPIASTGRWSGRHTLKVSNWGNAPARLRITPEDPDQALGFLVSPEIVDVPLGGEVVSRIKVRTRHPTLRGAAQRLPFQVTCAPDDGQAAGGAGPPPVSPASAPVVDGAFNQKPILTRLVVAVAVLALVAGIAGVAFLLTRDDETVAADQSTNPATPTGFQALDNLSPTEITLVWDEAKGVDGYRLFAVDPAIGKPGEAVEIAGATTTTVNAEVEPDTEMCFRLAAVRGGLPSNLTDETCSRTEAESTPEVPASEAPSPSATVAPVPGGGGGGGDGGSGSPTDPDAPPAAFITVLRAFGSDTGEEPARQLQAEYASNGIPAKVLLTTAYGLAHATPAATPTPGVTPSPSPVAPLWIVYVDGPSAQESVAACDAATARIVAAGGTPPQVPCASLTYQVVSRPSGQPSPGPSA
ncbi:hypothetical protein EKO23_17045 [Nocardioides guangzhouensis]|uniref:Fibronectin type-III domain-containing protein n=1 Tax=Nocardioides guangzhouensis TaxID=2497878 RepID=A0A4Q4Z8N5_9ACTN|nr:hypothetical protein [Nocardioides guangzhouensis]RYP84172.1 hypothetical protein EKO23_17045 [Nocardioides guangzhouensis]